MATMAAQRDLLMPRQPRGMGKGLVLALLVHALLIVALSLGVSWHNSNPAGVEAELWAAVPQVAAPRAVEPDPKPEPKPEPPKPVPKVEPAPVKAPDADIALEKEKREKEKLKQAEKDKEEAERKKKELADKKDQAEKAKRDEERLAALRDANLKRMMGQAGATGEPTATGNAQRDAGPSAGYAGRIKAYIKRNIVFNDTIDGNPEAVVRVSVSPDGTIVARRLTKSSGVPAFDDAVLRAIDKTAVLPRDTDGRVPPTIDVVFKPHE